MTCLLRALVSSSLLVLASGCPGDDGTGEGSDGSTAAGTTVVVDDTTAGADATAAGTAEGSGSASTGVGTTEAPATDSGSSTGPGATEGTTTGEGSSSGGAVGPSLGMCIGTGAWNNCTQYCESTGDTCVPSGCDGATIHYYNDVGACAAMEADQTSTMGCSEDFTMGMGISFARCCCE